MLISMNWINDFVDLSGLDLEKLIHQFTLSTAEVEDIYYMGRDIKDVVVARIISIENHPDSKKLHLLKVDAGDKVYDCVCGAPNVREGMLVAFAREGGSVSGMEITCAKIAGYESHGMCCSEKELGISADHSGLWEITDDLPLGTQITDAYGVKDVVFEVDNKSLTNRPDLWGHYGIAREFAALTNRELKPVSRMDLTPYASLPGIDIDIRDKELCYRYTGLKVRNITKKVSPVDMRIRLFYCGMRAINLLADLTNYLMLELGQPMHAFDYACLHDGKIIVRRAEEGESLRTLDGNDHALTPGMLVIADPEGPVALAGVMGGANSEITDETTTIVFESANFLGHSIRKTAIALGMRTDASGRFEKGLDLFATVPAVDRACELVEMLGAGEVFDGTIDVLAKEPETTFIELDDKRINALLGTDIPREFMADTLTSLGFELNGNTLTVPSWRGDCTMLADIAEECARFWGYDKIEATDIRGAATQGGYSEKTLFVQKLGTACRAMGYTEVVTYSFVSPSSLDKIKVPADSPLRDNYRILNPLGEDTSVMRTTALPSMLGVLSTNLSRRNMEAKLYEMATVYKKQPGKMLADERTVLTLGAYGGDVDFFALKGAVEALLCAARTPDVRFTADTETAAFHPGRCAAVWSGDTRLGTLGQIHPDVCAAYGLDGATYCAEIDVVLLHDLEGAEPVYTPLPRFPAITRDIAVVCDAAVPVGELTECIRKAEKNVLRGVKLFDVYTGVGIPEGKKSVAFSLTLRSDDGTLTDDHAEEAVRAVLDALRENFGAVIR